MSFGRVSDEFRMSFGRVSDESRTSFGEDTHLSFFNFCGRCRRRCRPGAGAAAGSRGPRPGRRRRQRPQKLKKRGGVLAETRPGLVRNSSETHPKRVRNSSETRLGGGYSLFTGPKIAEIQKFYLDSGRWGRGLLITGQGYKSEDKIERSSEFRTSSRRVPNEFRTSF